jgi:hypothetical protein
MATTKTQANRTVEGFVDEKGHEHKACVVCSVDCSTHPDAGNPLDCCGACGGATCPDHRDGTYAAICTLCQESR